MGYYTERYGMRKPIEKTYDIDPGKYEVLLGCCERYYDNIAWMFPEECEDGNGCCGLDKSRLVDEMKYEIPNLFIDYLGQIGVPRIVKNIFDDQPKVDDYDQYSLLDFIEFMAKNIRDVQKVEYHKFFNHYHLMVKNTRNVLNSFRDEINACFMKTGLLYILNSSGEVDRVIEDDVATPEIVQKVLSVEERGIKELLKEAIELHRSHRPNAIKDSVEKIWDAFERLKTYYTDTDKKRSAQKIVDDISGGKAEYKSLFETEFKTLTTLGNTYRIRHHETDKIEITDFRYYDYFFNRCLSLIALAVQYLQ